MGTRIVAFGHYDLDGGRSWAIRTGLAEHGCEVILCRTEAKGITGKYRDLLRQWKALKAKPDAVYVPFLGHWILPLAWWLTRRPRIPLVFDAFLSLYDTEVHDRKRYGAWHPTAWFFWVTDWLCCRLNDVVLIDTPEHAAYFTQTFGVPTAKMLPLPIGCRTDLFTPKHDILVSRSNPNARDGAALRRAQDDTVASGTQPLQVEFHGTFIPLQGIEVILQAAKILQDHEEDIRFRIIGKGQTYAAMRALAQSLLLTNVEFAGQVPMADLPTLVREADVCLGIFGTTDKALRVIPNKAYEVLSAGAALVTGRTPAALRALQDGEDALLVTPGDPLALADALTQLHADPALRLRLAEKGLALSLRAFQPHAIVAPLVAWLRSARPGPSP